MTGVLNAMVGGGGKFNYSVTIGSGAGPFYGYNEGSAVGSVSPGSFRGLTFADLSSRAGNHDFNLALNGAVAQTYFQYVMVQRSNGAWSIYRQQDALFLSNVDTIWTWGSGSDPAWTGTSPSPRQIIICF